MGLFSRKQSGSKLKWEMISSEQDLRNVMENTSVKPALFYKHSTRCSISSMALNRLESEWETAIENCNLYFIDLIAHRNVSNLLADLTGVPHQSPQAILVKNNEVLYDASHSSINAKNIEQKL